MRESRALADEQRRIRKAVADVVFARAGSGGGAEESSDEEGGAADAGGSARERVLEAARRASERAGAQGALDFEEDESPVVAINRPLLEAYNHMWDAARALEVAEPAQAIPPMRLALDAIQRARQAERVYLRGRPPEVIVDVARVRLQGKRPEETPAERSGRAALDPAARRRAERLDAAIARLTVHDRAAVDSLVLLRLDALPDAPALAAALGDAVEALRRGRDATAALGRARRLAVGEPRVADTLPAWEGAP